MKIRKMCHTISSVIAGLLLFSTIASAQSIWLNRSSNKTLALEWIKANYKQNTGYTFTTSTGFLTGRFPVGEKAVFSAELPFSIAAFESRDNEFALGNPFIGLEVHSGTSPAFAEIGARIPLVDGDSNNEEAAEVGFFYSLVERAEAFVEDAVPVIGAVNYVQNQDNGFLLKLRAGAAMWIPIKGRDETEIFLLYSGQTGFQNPKYRLIAGVSGRWWLSGGSGSSFANTTWHQLGITGDVAFGKFRPGLYFQLPFDDTFKRSINYIAGLTLNIDLNN